MITGRLCLEPAGVPPRRQLQLFREMQALDFDRRALPYATLLSVAGSLPHIGIGKQINAQLVSLGFLRRILWETL
jgi:hypothetical protein